MLKQNTELPADNNSQPDSSGEVSPAQSVTSRIIVEVSELLGQACNDFGAVIGALREQSRSCSERLSEIRKFLDSKLSDDWLAVCLDETIPIEDRIEFQSLMLKLEASVSDQVVFKYEGALVERANATPDLGDKLKYMELVTVLYSLGFVKPDDKELEPLEDIIEASNDEQQIIEAIDLLVSNELSGYRSADYWAGSLEFEQLASRNNLETRLQFLCPDLRRFVLEGKDIRLVGRSLTLLGCVAQGSRYLEAHHDRFKSAASNTVQLKEDYNGFLPEDFENLIEEYIFGSQHFQPARIEYLDDSSAELETEMPTLHKILSDDEKTTRLLIVLASLRMWADYSPFDRRMTDQDTPIAWTEKARMGVNLRELVISQFSESFRRHLIYTRDEYGGVQYALEIKIPGQAEGREIISDKDSSIARELMQRFPADPAVVKPLFLSTLRKFPALYSGITGWRDSSETGVRPNCRIVGFYYEDGQRLSNVAPESPLYEQAASDRCAARVLGLAFRMHRMGYRFREDGFTDMHAENFRILRNGEIVLVADFALFTMADKPLDIGERKAELENLMNGLVQIRKKRAKQEWSDPLSSPDNLSDSFIDELVRSFVGNPEATKGEVKALARYALEELGLGSDQIDRHVERIAPLIPS